MNAVPVNNLEEILERWKKVIETTVELDMSAEAKAGFQKGLKKAYDDIYREAEWE